MSRKSEQLASDVVAAAVARYGVNKAAGGTAVLWEIARPMAEMICKQDKRIRKTSREIRRQTTRIMKSIAGGGPGPVTPQHGMVPLRAGEWEVGLKPTAQPQRNGFGLGLSPEEQQ